MWLFNPNFESGSGDVSWSDTAWRLAADRLGMFSIGSGQCFDTFGIGADEARGRSPGTPTRSNTESYLSSICELFRDCFAPLLR